MEGERLEQTNPMTDILPGNFLDKHRRCTLLNHLMRGKNACLILAAAMAGAILPLAADDEGQDTKPVTMKRALELGPEKLAEATNSSEAGQDWAATLYTLAKRIETEKFLSEKDLELVMQLDSWREVIGQCRQSAFELGYVINRGGTRFSHEGTRDAAKLEDFLSRFARKLPLQEGDGDAKALRLIDDAIASLAKLKVVDLGDAKTNAAAAKELAEEIERVNEFWETLKGKIEKLPPAAAIDVAEFATQSLSLLKEQ